MQDILDLKGATGEAYRFRRLDRLGEAPATAGAFVYVRWEGAASVMLFLGESDSLLAAGVRWAEAQARHRATDVYVRLNVAHEARAREGQDMLGVLQPIMNRVGGRGA